MGGDCEEVKGATADIRLFPLPPCRVRRRETLCTTLIAYRNNNIAFTQTALCRKHPAPEGCCYLLMHNHGIRLRRVRFDLRLTILHRHGEGRGDIALRVGDFNRLALAVRHENQTLTKTKNLIAMCFCNEVFSLMLFWF